MRIGPAKPENIRHIGLTLALNSVQLRTPVTSK